ncbi:short-chain dehydrogenase [Stenotrophomonas sp. Betaine-02u-21]|uniref:SDR family NAD(P)-dependent oxidoreductase n=1 Tax=unclassified Stenotrophomonas TaxID=196198 RepID=UPI000C329787|nr:MULTISPECIES: glucose 1-dehydrogenase [unclassified Stenotrophomonas]PKH74051.1 short-chain dehydrogenase [Stenotrophomonas sp. Betaine-02u-21]PKH76502.1 short-chain dehydrogenase [Stenotrophomonas sp. Betaine-02u-23]PKH94249.1 short-chain dehydrogenase [Stenotrophomonas sp. Bg11-02]
MNRLKGKVCIITGASVGIGRACAVRMAEEGAAVALFDIHDGEGNALVNQLAGAGSAAIYWHVDVREEASVQNAIDAVVDRFGRLDVMVNNAGIAGVNRPTHELSEADWDQVQAVNVKGVFFCTKHALPHMRRNRVGSIINLSSIYGLVGAADLPAYHASKGAVTLMSKTDALTYASDGIRVNSVHPGFIWTPLVEQHLRDSGTADLVAGRHALDQLHPLGHVGTPDDIAWGVVYLASEESRFVTGSSLVIDGGYTAR